MLEFRPHERSTHISFGRDGRGCWPMARPAATCSSAALQSGDAPELWNADHPDRVAQLHRAFVEAGADIILTNSFGGTRHRLKLHKAEHRVAELNEKAARIARGEADRAGREVLVAGSMGPTGEILEPLGPLSLDAARDAFAEQAAALARGGADILWIETMSSVEETEAAVAGARTTRPADRRHIELRYQRPDHDGHHAGGARGPASQARSRGVRQQLRHGTFRTRRLHRQSCHRLGSLGHSRRQSELRHSAVHRRRDPLQRHAGIDGAIRLLVAGCGRADHRRLLRHHPRAPARHAPGARRACARVETGSRDHRIQARRHLDRCNRAIARRIQPGSRRRSRRHRPTHQPARLRMRRTH